MSSRFVNIDRQTPMLLPADVQEWVQPDHLARFIVDAVDALDIHGFKVNERGTGDAQYPPRMLLSLLAYCYATGTFSSRQIERASYENLPVRFICANTHPDHDTICTFRRENRALFEESFVKVLQLARELKILKVGQVTIAHDGTKIQANASKHSAVSYERAGQMIQELEREVKQLIAKAEEADSKPLQEGLSIPEEITRRQERKAQLQKARAVIEERARQRAQAQQPEHEEKVAQRQARRQAGEKVRGKDPQAPTPTPQPKDQYNFTDPESRIMKAGNAQHFEQAYNAQASVEVESRLIVGPSLTDQANDKQQLVGAVETVQDNGSKVGAILVDNGYYSEAAVRQVETNPQGQPTGTTVYAAVGKTSHHRSVEDLEKKEEPVVPGLEATIKEIMEHRLRTQEGKGLYDLRKETVEPIFGIIKETMGFRRFSMRSKAKAALEWTLVTLSYNLRRLHCVQMRRRSGGLAIKMSQALGKRGLERVRVWFSWARMTGRTKLPRGGHLLPRLRNILTTRLVLYPPYPPLRRTTGSPNLSPTGC
jgi:transposase